MTATPLRRPPVPPAVYELIERSRSTLEAACHTSDASERYLDAHLGALRAAAALVAARTAPSPRSRPRSVWQVLPALAPELGEWAAFFAGTASRRAVIDRGGWLSAREADDLLRQAEMFLEIVLDRLGILQTTPLPDSVTPLLAGRPVALVAPASTGASTSTGTSASTGTSTSTGTSSGTSTGDGST